MDNRESRYTITAKPRLLESNHLQYFHCQGVSVMDVLLKKGPEIEKAAFEIIGVRKSFTRTTDAKRAKIESELSKNR